jgi:hypothetical protein
MKQVKLSDVHHQMLLEISRKWKVSPRDLVGRLIFAAYEDKRNNFFRDITR